MHIYVYICIIINVCIYIIFVYAGKVINTAEFADAMYLLSQAAQDASLVNVAIAFTLQKQHTDFFKTSSQISASDLFQNKLMLHYTIHMQQTLVQTSAVMVYPTQKSVGFSLVSRKNAVFGSVLPDAFSIM